MPTSAAKLSADEIATQIKLAGASLNWQIDDVAPGRLRGTLHAKDHVAVVAITVAPASYSITLESSVNLLQNPDGTIHRRYNQWVSALRNKIDAQINLAGLQKS